LVPSPGPAPPRDARFASRDMSARSTHVSVCRAQHPFFRSESRRAQGLPEHVEDLRSQPGSRPVACCPGASGSRGWPAVGCCRAARRSRSSPAPWPPPGTRFPPSALRGFCAGAVPADTVRSPIPLATCAADSNPATRMSAWPRCAAGAGAVRAAAAGGANFTQLIEAGFAEHIGRRGEPFARFVTVTWPTDTGASLASGLTAPTSPACSASGWRTCAATTRPPGVLRGQRATRRGRLHQHASPSALPAQMLRPAPTPRLCPGLRARLLQPLPPGRRLYC